jgi:hypothetical protein
VTRVTWPRAGDYSGVLREASNGSVVLFEHSDVVALRTLEASDKHRSVRFVGRLSTGSNYDRSLNHRSMSSEGKVRSEKAGGVPWSFSP